MKRCKKCGEWKPDDDFYRFHKGSDKRNSSCKVCDNKRRVAEMSHGDRGTTGKYCKLCLGMPWRITGAKCQECGTLYAEEQW